MMMLLARVVGTTKFLLFNNSFEVRRVKHGEIFAIRRREKHYVGSIYYYHSASLLW